MPFLCDRIDPRLIDFETSRFVVANCRGIETAQGLIKRGEEMPHGLLTARGLRLEYEQHRIETVEFTQKDPLLSEACALAGVELDPVAHKQQERKKFLDSIATMTRKDLQVLARKHGVSSEGNQYELHQRLAALVG